MSSHDEEGYKCAPNQAEDKTWLSSRPLPKVERLTPMFLTTTEIKKMLKPSQKTAKKKTRLCCVERGCEFGAQYKGGYQKSWLVGSLCLCGLLKPYRMNETPSM